MNSDPRGGRVLRFATLVFVAIAPGSAILADSVVMKSGMTFRTLGPPDKDGTLVYLWDGLKKTVIRDSKIERIVPDSTLRTGEKFHLVQPLTVHAGIMPKDVLSVEAGPWNDKGRRQFRYVGKTNRPIAMEQAINEIGPYIVRYRGVDGFWQGQTAVSQVPRPVMMSLLRRVQQENQNERERVARYLMGVGWYPEAREELDRLIKDFPDSDLSARAKSARTFIVQAEATQRRAEVDVRRRAQQPEATAALLKTFSEPEIGTEIQIEVRDIMRRDEDQRTADAETDKDLHRLELKLSPKNHGEWKERLAEVHKALQEAPDAVRSRFAAWLKARSGAAISDEAQLALAMSGYVVGHEAAVTELDQADALWKARGLIASYLREDDDASREGILAQLDDVAWPSGETAAPGYRKLELASLMVPLMPPPLPRGEADEGDKGLLRHVVDGGDAATTEYLVKLPPEYHSLRVYPALVVLHSGKGPQSALEQWEAEAARRGYILVAPEYGVPGQSPEYHYTASEHAAVELAVRDARKRYNIDSDRVFLAGQLQGGNMAWDFGLGHPDLFAGLVVVSGFPAKYVTRSMSQHERLPLFCVLGDLAPAANEVVFNNYVKPMILKTWDVTYMEFHRRGLEEFPEEIPTFFDWMDRRRREPVPKSFEAVSARTCDDRRNGVVIRGFAEGRATAPEAVDVLGQNLRPATLKMKTSSISNLVDLQLDGVTQVDIWLSPKLVDFKRKFEVRINRNRKPTYKGQPTLELKPMLEDLRIRGDRQQLYWFKIEAG
jgi:pimeloyl-ACP methyl ester carboxylesterase